MISRVTGTAIQAQATNIYHKAIADYGISAIIMFLTTICLFTPPLLFFKQVAANTLYVMLAFLVAGFFFFTIKMERLMMVSFICCSILCLHLKASTNKKMRLAAVTSSPSLTISHINLGNAENDYDSVINYMLKLQTDVISVQELTPDWTAMLKERLSPQYKYNHTMTRLDQYGMGFFSKLPINSVDTLYFNQIPNLSGRIQLDAATECHVLSCQVTPPVNQAAFSMISQHFGLLTDYLLGLDEAVIVLGDMHLPPWSTEVQSFKTMSLLEDSRRDINPRNVDGSMSLPRIPVDHIFYCNKFECTSFSELGSAVVGRVGITGTYQLQNGYGEVE